MAKKVVDLRQEHLIYVAPDGHDSNPGTCQRPCATLEQARILAAAISRNECQGIHVLVRAGTYYLSQPLVFASTDSGSQDCPVIFQAYPGEQPVISGGYRIDGPWKPYRNGIMMCRVLPSSFATGNFTQLFVNGRRQIRARYPDYEIGRAHV